ncbi:MAG: DivIVA domain-containing protein [Bacilli bacterium]|nr:DivIVA domain-containing protein [Bacilli bacterium]
MPEKFKTAFNGYNKEDVNSFIKSVTKEYESMLERLKKSDAENEDLKKKLVEYQNLENTLRRSLLIAEESNKELRRVAKNESIQMVEEARRNASRIVNDALIKAERIEANADALKRRAIMYKRKIKQLLDEQNQMLDKFDDIEY